MIFDCDFIDTDLLRCPPLLQVKSTEDQEKEDMLPCLSVSVH